MNERRGNIGCGYWPIAACLAVCFLVLIFASSAAAQSTLQDFPTAVTSNQVAGAIDARRIGDPRATTYYYLFKGESGDVFVNVVTENFQGDIDVLLKDGLKLLTRMVILADTEPSETGRVIYLRKPEHLLLRVQGKTPNDDPAKFQIKFAGSFLALTADEAQPVPEMPRVSKPVFKDAVAEDSEVKEPSPELAVKADEPPPADETTPEVKPPADIPSVKLEVVRTENTGKAAEPASPTAKRERTSTRQRRTDTPARNTPPVRSNSKKAPPASVAKQSDPENKPPPAKEKPVDPMAAFRLVVIFKDGSKIERPMTEVLRFTVDRGILTVIGKDGRIGRYSMAEIQRVGIE